MTTPLIWDNANKGTHIPSPTRQGSCAIGSVTGSDWESILGTISHNSGKWYIEFYVAGWAPEHNGMLFGFGKSGVNLNSYAGSDGNSFGWQLGSQWFGSGGSLNGVSSDISGDPGGHVIAIAIDIGNGLLWFRHDRNLLWNNDASADPATGTNGKTITNFTSVAQWPMVSLQTDSGDGRNVVAAAVINGGMLPFSLTKPSGFSQWDDSGGTFVGDTSIGGTTPTVWDSGGAGAHFTFSGLNAQKTGATNTWTGVKTTSSRSGGKAYFEFVRNHCWGGASGTGQLYGFARSDAPVNNYPGNSILSIAAQSGAQEVINDGSYKFNWDQTSTDGDVIGVAVDIDKGLWWIRNVTNASNWNNSASADPVAGVIGMPIENSSDLFIILGLDDAGSGGGGKDDVTLDLAGPFIGTPPTGFGKWEPAAGAGSLLVTAGFYMIGPG